MNTGAIDLTVGAHDARNAVHRLTLLVSDPRCPVRIIPATPALAHGDDVAAQDDAPAPARHRLTRHWCRQSGARIGPWRASGPYLAVAGSPNPSRRGRR
jgi:hypothetical protein